jgi:hypothetical protein
MNESKILFIGNSKKFIQPFLNYYKCSAYDIVEWRKISTHTHKYDSNIIIVLGFHHDLYHKRLSSFIESNVNEPYKFIKNNLSQNKALIYIDSMPPDKTYTYSRYLYAKRLLLERLYVLNSKTIQLSFPTIIDESKMPILYANIFERILGYIFLKIKKTRTIFVDEIETFIINNIKNQKNIKIKFKIQPKFLYVRRTRLIDKLLRIIYG